MKRLPRYAGAAGLLVGTATGAWAQEATVPAPREIHVCVVENGALREVSATYDPQTGDTLVNGQPFSTVYPSTTGYAQHAVWYINGEPITFLGRRHVWFGLPRVLGVTEVMPVGEYRGITLFAETPASDRPLVVYVPVRTGCEFLPYVGDLKGSSAGG